MTGGALIAAANVSGGFSGCGHTIVTAQARAIDLSVIHFGRR